LTSSKTNGRQGMLKRKETVKIHPAVWVVVLLMLLSIPSPAATLYVSLNSINPVPPYADWSTDATNIQDAIDGVNDGDLN